MKKGKPMSRSRRAAWIRFGIAAFFAVAFVPPALLLRYYAHAKDYPTTLKAVITTFFVTVVLFMWAMLRYKFITF